LAVSAARGDPAHRPFRNLPAELWPQFVRAGLDDRGMGNPHDRAVGLIQGPGDFRGLAPELIEFFLECGRRPIPGSTLSLLRFDPPKLPRAALYHRMPEFSS
jgi:hypothetical protein